MKLTAQKSFRYNNRRLEPGDDFETKKEVHGVLLLASKKVRKHRAPGKISAPPKAIAEKVKPQAVKAEAPADVVADAVEVTSEPVASAAEDLAPLRDEYQAKVGKRPFMGWDGDTLRAKMAEAEAPAADADEDDDEAAAS